MNEDSYSKSSDASIHLDGVSLRFLRYGQGVRSFRRVLLDALRGRREKPSHDYWVYQDLSLRIRHGERVGIIGRNGAGKTTLLKLITAVYPPTHGQVRVTGKVTPLLELQAGMNMDLTGLENIYLVGSLLGWDRRRIQEKVPEIVSFAGLEDFIRTPVRCYSSGMATRLAFSIASSMDPEILLLDEVFAVGDQEFTPRAMEKIHALMDVSHIMVLTSHNLKHIRELTNRAIWIDRGRIMLDGDPETVCQAYEHSLNPKPPNPVFCT